MNKFINFCVLLSLLGFNTLATHERKVPEEGLPGQEIPEDFDVDLMLTKHDGTTEVIRKKSSIIVSSQSAHFIGLLKFALKQDRRSLEIPLNGNTAAIKKIIEFLETGELEKDSDLKGWLDLIDYAVRFDIKPLNKYIGSSLRLDRNEEVSIRPQHIRHEKILASSV